MAIPKGKLKTKLVFSIPVEDPDTISKLSVMPAEIIKDVLRVDLADALVHLVDVLSRGNLEGVVCDSEESHP